MKDWYHDYHPHYSNGKKIIMMRKQRSW